MKLEPHLPHVPSITELMDHPRVKGLVERINSSTLAQRAIGFLDEVRRSLVKTGRSAAPSLTHLAERFARQLLGETAEAACVINATGLVLGNVNLSLPLPDRCLHAILRAGGEFHSHDISSMRPIEQGLANLGGAESALLATSFEAAIALVLAATTAKGEAVILTNSPGARSAIDWQRLAALAGVVVREQPPSSAQVNTDSSRASPTASCIIRGPDLDLWNESGRANAPALKQLANAQSCLIDVAPFAGIIDPAQFGYQSVDTIERRLEAGADLVVVDGAGLIGGAGCGLIFSNEPMAATIRREPLAKLLAPSSLTLAASAALLELYDENSVTPAIYQIPVWQLLSAPLENLEQRARRLAELLAESAEVKSASAVQIDSPWMRWAGRDATAPSWAIELRPRDGDVRSLAMRFARGRRPISVREEVDRVVLDMRSVFPRWDQQLVAAVETGTSSPDDAEIPSGAANPSGGRV